MCISPTRAAAKDKSEMNKCIWRFVRCKDNTGMRLTLVSPGVIQVVEYRNQNIQHITALQDKKQELLSWEHKGDFVEYNAIPKETVHFSS